MLVRVLNQSDYVKGTAPAVKVEQHAYVGSDGKNYSVYRLAITSTAVSPDFKILVFPFSGQEALPLTTWSSNKTTLRVDFNDEHTTLSLINNTTGSTSVQLIKTTATAIGAAPPGPSPWPQPGPDRRHARLAGGARRGHRRTDPARRAGSGRAHRDRDRACRRPAPRTPPGGPGPRPVPAAGHGRRDSRHPPVGGGVAGGKLTGIACISVQPKR